VIVVAVKEAAFAGSWYPAGASACEKEIEGFLEDPAIRSVEDRPIAGGIVPHAGWFFSGSIACHVIRCLGRQTIPDVIVIFGMHLAPRSPRYIMTEGAWQTPFGPLTVEKDLAAELTRRLRFTVEREGRYLQDNTIELQLPFIKYFFNDVKIVPIGVPPESASLEVGRAVVEIAAEIGLRVKVIGSTDLTHYGSNYGFAPKGKGRAAVDWVREENDRRVIDAMLALDPGRVIDEALARQNACCAGAAATAIEAGKRLGAKKADMLAYMTSYDKVPGDSLVGYVGMVF